MEYSFIFLLDQLLGQAPLLLAYVVGVILALVFWRRCPRPSMLTFLAMMLLLITTLVQAFLIGYLLQGGWNPEKLRLFMRATVLMGNLLHMTAIGLILAAVFIGRKVAQQSRPNQTLQLTGPASRQSEEHGITSRPTN